ncbi:MAG: KilA-N domain-containing protein [Bacteroidales bacterium]
MHNEKKHKILVKGSEIKILSKENNDYISLSDMVKNFEGGNALIEQWLRNKDTVEFLGIWESLNNPDFNSPEFEGIKNKSGSNRFYLSVKKWVQSTNATGIIAKAGRYGGTYAHKDIAFEFGSWLSPEFKLYLIKEFQNLKEEESKRKNLEWNFQRYLAKVNYHIHTDAIKHNLIPEELSHKQVSYIYASEADVLNMALFGTTAKQWRDDNPGKEGNLRDHATIEHLVVLTNLESINAMLIHQDISQPERLRQLNHMAITQMKSLSAKVLKNSYEKRNS